jgi:parallel beta-helix repeat protein
MLDIVRAPPLIGRTFDREGGCRVLQYRLGVAIVAVMAAAVGVPVARAAQSAVTCGETITRNVTLVADLGCASTPALRIGAPGVTLNLNGHRIAAGTTGMLKKPVVVDTGYGSVTIENGLVYPEQANVGVGLTDASNVDLVDLESSSNVWPLTISGGRGDVIRGSTLIGNGGVTVDGSDNLRLADDSIDRINGTALTLDHVDNAAVVDTAFHGGGPGVSVMGSGNLIEGQSSSGIEVVSGSGNTIDGVDLDGGGITVDAAATRTVVHASISLGAGGIDVAGPDARITGNTVSFNGVGIDVSGLGARIARNTLNSNRGDGIEVSGSAASILDNTASGNDQDGIEVSGPGARINGNTVSANEQNGIEVTDPTARVDRNIAEDNTLFGITAAVGDIGSSNSASANNSVGGMPGEQCLNIECEIGPS